MIENICEKITNRIKIKNPNFDDERLEVINFGLLVLFGEVPKILIIFLFAWYFKILELTVVTFVAIAIYRTQAGGFHLEGHLSCLSFSLLVFCGTSFLAKLIVTNNLFLLYILYGLIFIFNLLVINKYAPADTENVPIINMQKRRKKKIYSYMAVIILYVFAIFVLTDQVISNICILATFIQSICMTPITYKISKCEYGEITKLEMDMI